MVLRRSAIVVEQGTRNVSMLVPSAETVTIGWPVVGVLVLMALISFRMSRD